jgi:DEAD/DEAH box helicase domain-containing protein
MLPPASHDLPLARFKDRIIASREIPPRPSRYSPFPAALHPALRKALELRGIEQLYCHQTEAFEAAQAGENVVLTTGTASGKSLAYLLPVIQAVLDDPTARALLIFPTKALSQDQLRGVLELIDQLSGKRIEAGVYDGDTPPAERTRIRDRCHLVLTNPDMLNAALLPNHGRQGYSHIFRNLKYVVIDELHAWRGAGGSHTANLMRRLWRICRHYHSKPQVLASSATIANAREHAETICHLPFRLVDQDGSPSGGKIIYFWQPPLLGNDQRKSVTTEMALLVPYLIEKRHRTIAFCRSRKETEIVLKESRDRMKDVAGHDEGYLLAGYRGGYTPEERRKVEKQLTDGRLMGVISTNALELGIDIGALEIVVQGGFPGTRASFWQQIGRAGRRGEMAYAIVMLAVSPSDQYIAQNPDWLTGQPAEHAVVDRDNLAIQLAHVRAAAAELPLTLDDAAVFPDLGEILPVLKKAGEVRDIHGAWHWNGGPFPAGEFSLRNIDPDRFKIVNRLTGKTITEMDRPQVYREGHTRAVYLHDGVQYQVETLDLVAHVATVVPVEQNFYTQPDVRTNIDVLLTQETKDLLATSLEVPRSTAYFGDIAVDDAVVGYKMLEFHNHQNLGYEALHEPLRLHLETEALWLSVPEAVLAVLGKQKQDALAGMVQAVLACARLRTMAEQSDVRGTSFHYVDELTGKTVTALVFYDSHPGGLGYAAKAFDFRDAVLEDACNLVAHCRCKNGCPACVGDYTRDRKLILWALRNLTEVSAAPEGSRIPLPGGPALGQVRDRIPWLELRERWEEAVARLQTAQAFGAEILAQVREVKASDDMLIVVVGSPGLADWLAMERTKQRVMNAIASQVEVPTPWRLNVEVPAEDREKALLKTIKLNRRHDDLTKDVSHTEYEGNENLASGFISASDPPITPGTIVLPGDTSIN